MTMDETTLLFRHLPSELSKEERKDLLFSFGASRVHVMGTSGRLKNTAFAAFPSKDHATEVLHQLHQADLLGSKLVVEIARCDDSRTPCLLDADKKMSVTSDGDLKPGESKAKMEPKEIKFDATFGVWGLKHPRRPELRYRYPPPTPSILTNIMNALMAVPKFYVQVLHLMNKMDLPAPFGTVTPVPPFVPSHVMPDDVVQKEMEISSSDEASESEMESDGEGKNDNRSQDSKALADNASRRRRKNLKKLVRTKKPRLSEFQQSDNFLSESTTTNVPIQDVFEQMPGSSTTAATQSAKKMALNLKLSSIENSDRKKLSGPSEIQNQQQYHLQQQLPQSFSSSLSSSSSVLSQIPPTAKKDNNESRTQLPFHPHHQHLNLPSHSHQPQQYHSTPLPPPQMQPPLPPLPAQDMSQESRVGYQHCNDDPEMTAVNPVSKSQMYSFEDNDLEDNSVDKPGTTTEGFGIIQHKVKVADGERREEDGSQSPSDHTSGRLDKKFISSSALRRGRLTKEEMKDSSVFRRYDPGEASCRLYIKNVARQANEEDLRYIYGRYVDWESETEINMFDVRLMKEGRMKGQAFVTLPSQEVASDALSDTNGFLLKEKPLVVQFARSAKAQEDAAAVKS